MNLLGMLIARTCLFPWVVSIGLIGVELRARLVRTGLAAGRLERLDARSSYVVSASILMRVIVDTCTLYCMLTLRVARATFVPGELQIVGIGMYCGLIRSVRISLGLSPFGIFCRGTDVQQMGRVSLPNAAYDFGGSTIDIVTLLMSVVSLFLTFGELTDLL